jgi:hypothetical protein
MYDTLYGCRCVTAEALLKRASVRQLLEKVGVWQLRQCASLRLFRTKTCYIPALWAFSQASVLCDHHSTCCYAYHYSHAYHSCMLCCAAMRTINKVAKTYVVVRCCAYHQLSTINTMLCVPLSHAYHSCMLCCVAMRTINKVAKTYVVLWCYACHQLSRQHICCIFPSSSIFQNNKRTCCRLKTLRPS